VGLLDAAAVDAAVLWLIGLGIGAARWPIPNPTDQHRLNRIVPATIKPSSENS